MIRRRSACAAALVVCGLTSACDTPHDHASAFFPGAVDTYGLTLAAVDRDHLVELGALRQIDSCGFVDRKTLAGNGHTDFSYAHTAVREILSDGSSLLMPVGGDGCTIAFPSATTALVLRLLPGEPRGNDGFFASVPAHPGVSTGMAPNCAFRVSLPLRGMPGAPTAMHDPRVEVTLENTVGGWQTHVVDTSLCGLVEAVAESIASRVRDRGVPAYPGSSASSSKFLTSDPCAAASDLHAVGFIWEEPAPEAQSPTTWRQPSVCDIRLRETNGDPATAAPVRAIVKYGLASWSDSTVESLSGGTPERSERNGITLLAFGSDAACFVVAKAKENIAPTAVGTGAPGLAAATPVVTVRLRAPAGNNCVVDAENTALAALERATHH